ncbi:Hypothetical predicted protein [Paramuricea clavata]|uniref:Uncharacterized protein n=1 Tax=Paramuricea clavata TaxID=317549 RepID=A0A6S7I3R2_PARCT|nr:Hypothetical predicted protein [Paramuricea clavata]
MPEGRQYFSQLKKSLLTKLMRKHKDLVESEKNDYKTIQQKNNTPRQKSTGEREERGEVTVTGGGLSTSKQDDEAAAVASIIPAQIDSLSNMFDDDNFEIEIDRDDDETDLEATTTGTGTAPNENELLPSVVDAALTPSLTKTSQISAAEACTMFGHANQAA